MVFVNSFQLDRETERRLLSASSTLYVGNLSFYTTEAQIYEREFRRLAAQLTPVFATCAKPEEGGGIKR